MSSDREGQLEVRVAVVTGGSGGIGAAIAERLAADVASVASTLDSADALAAVNALMSGATTRNAPVKGH